MMSESNPHTAPGGPAEIRSADTLDAARVASGKKLIIYACVVYLGGLVLFGGMARLASGMYPADGGTVMVQLTLLWLLASLGLSFIGTDHVVSGLAWPRSLRIALLVLMFVSFANLITLLIVNSYATKALRDAGYRAGFFGASKSASSERPSKETLTTRKRRRKNRPMPLGNDNDQTLHNQRWPAWKVGFVAGLLMAAVCFVVGPVLNPTGDLKELGERTSLLAITAGSITAAKVRIVRGRRTPRG
jgi:hypothetical protein